MTECSPLVTVTRPPSGLTAAQELEHITRAGRIVAGTQVRIVDDAGTVLPHDGTAVGEIEVRGPWITGSYYEVAAPEKFRDGALRTGDAGTVDPSGVITLTDRLKDVIKSGGEWISSVELENLLAAHPAVAEAAVVAIEDPRWDERPLACVVLHEGAEASPEALRAFLAPHVTRWWLPESWTYLDEIPKTSVGKLDKKRLRCQHAEGMLTVISTPARADLA